MKQKYVVLLDNETGKLAIQEYAELDKEILSLLCEETYDTEVIKAAMKKDRSTLIQSLRTHNMYPPGTYTERIADTIEQMFQPGANTSAELFFEEREMFGAMEEDVASEPDEGESTGMEVDDLLDDDVNDGLEDKTLIKNIKKSVPISDESTSIDDA